MDVFDFRKSRSLNLKDAFSSVEVQQNLDMGGLFVRLKNLMVAEVHGHWDIALLEKYLDDNMVPRSLRFEITPQEDEIDLPGWYKYFNDVGLDLLRFLIARKRRKLNKLDEEISEVKEKLSLYRESEEYKNKSDNLRKTLEKEDLDQKVKKKKKYMRDMEDYKSNQVFKWQVRWATPVEGGTVPPPGPATRIKSSVPPTIQGNNRETNNAHTPKGGWRRVVNNKKPPPSRNPQYKGAPHKKQNNSDYAQYDHPSYAQPEDIPVYNRYAPLEEHHDGYREYNDRGYDDRYIVQHPSLSTPGNAYQEYGRSGWDSPGFYPPRRSQYYNQGPPHHSGPSTSASSFFPKAPQKNKRGGEPREGPEGGGGTDRKRRRV